MSLARLLEGQLTIDDGAAQRALGHELDQVVELLRRNGGGAASADAYAFTAASPEQTRYPRLGKHRNTHGIDPAQRRRAVVYADSLVAHSRARRSSSSGGTSLTCVVIHQTFPAGSRTPPERSP